MRGGIGTGRFSSGFLCAGIALAVLVSASVGASAADGDAAGVDLLVIELYWCDMYGNGGSGGISITSGQPYTVSATVENIGAEDSGAFCVDLLIDGSLAGTAMVSSGLPASRTITVNWYDVVTSNPGTHTVLVVADSLESIAEENPEGTAEDNNEMSSALIVVRAQWTFAVYMSADNNLEWDALLDLIEMAKVGTSPAVSIVVQIDRSPGYVTDYGDWTDANRFLVTRSMEPVKESAYEQLGEVDMGDGAVFSDFASDAFGRFRAERTCLVMWGHGGGWYRGCLKDESSSNDTLKTYELRGAMTEATAVMGAMVDIVAFDSCNMESMDVCYAFDRLCVDFVGSQGGVPGTGFAYDGILKALGDDPSIGSEPLCEIFVSEYLKEYVGFPQITLSAFRVHEICTSARDALTGFADSLIAGGDLYDQRIQLARDAVSGYDLIPTDPDLEETYSADIYYFAEQISLRIQDAQVQSSAAALKDALEDARIALGLCSQFTKDGEIFGISLFWPDEAVYLDAYSSELLSQDTTWDEFLLEYYSP